MKHRVFPPKRATETGGVPAVLPLVVFETHESDQLVMTVNGDKSTVETLDRNDIGTRLSELMAGFGVPTRVEIHEQDGTVHADILQPPPKPTEQDESPELGELEHPRGRRRKQPDLVELEATGFVPGEDVAVAVVLRHGSAGPDGRARALIDRTEIPGADGAEVVLLGRISGTTAVRSLT